MEILPDFNTSFGTSWQILDLGCGFIGCIAKQHGLACAQAGRSCDTDLDCETTDATGRTGSCTCKAEKIQQTPAVCCARTLRQLRNFENYAWTDCKMTISRVGWHFAKNRQAWWDKDDPKYCKPVSGDFSRHQEALRNYLWFRLLQLWTLHVSVCLMASSIHTLALNYQVLFVVLTHEIRCLRAMSCSWDRKKTVHHAHFKAIFRQICDMTA